MGGFVFASPGYDDFGLPVYYPSSTDPWYQLNLAAGANESSVGPVIFHAPSAAQFSAGDEHELLIWDQATGWVVQICSTTPQPS